MKAATRLCAISILAFVSACGTLLGVDDFTDAPSGADGRGGQGTGAQGNTGGQGGSAAGSGQGGQGGEGQDGVVARADSYRVTRGEASYRVTKDDGLLANDSGLGSGLSVTAEERATSRGGSVSLAADGSFEYTPPSGTFWGDDTFAYELDADGTTVMGEVRFTVHVSAVESAELHAGNGNGFAIIGYDPTDSAGRSVASAGDPNGDGIDDVIVGAPHQDFAGIEGGASYVIFGKKGAGEGAPRNLGITDVSSTAPGAAGYVAVGPGEAQSGWSVAFAGDANDDGIDDVVIGAPFHDGGAGSIYVLFGKGSTTPVNLATVGSDGFHIQGNASSAFAGWSVGGVGDINDDGYDDVVIGAPDANGSAPGSGKAYVVYGRNDGTQVDLATFENSFEEGFVIQGAAADDDAGFSVAGAGDVNDDGIDDIVVGAEYFDSVFGTDVGRTYVIFGNTFQGPTNLANPDSYDGFTIDSSETGGWSGVSVAGAGDVNDDGLDDIIVGASRIPYAGLANAGAAFVVFGKKDEVGVSLGDLLVGNGEGFAIVSTSSDTLVGDSVFGGGDFNGDDLDDVIVGAPMATPDTRTGAGIAYVVFGKSSQDPILLDDLDEDGVAIYGVMDGDRLGTSVSFAGDVNDDGLDDVIVGAPYYDDATRTGHDGVGAAYVVFGWHANDPNAITP